MLDPVVGRRFAILRRRSDFETSNESNPDAIWRRLMSSESRLGENTQKIARLIGPAIQLSFWALSGPHGGLCVFAHYLLAIDFGAIVSAWTRRSITLMIGQ